MREAVFKAEQAEQKIEEASKAIQVLDELAEDASADAMKAACEKAGVAQGDASKLVQDARVVVASRQKEARNVPGGAVPSADDLTEFSKLTARLTAAQAAIEKNKNALRENEHRFVARRLLKDAETMVAELEAKT